MKVGELAKQAEDAVNLELQERVAQMIACKIQEIRAAKRVVSKLEKQLEDLKQREIDDFLLESPALRCVYRPKFAGRRILSIDPITGGAMVEGELLDAESSSGE